MKKRVAPASVAETAESNKKPRKKAVTAKSLGLSKEEYDSIKVPPIRKTLKEHCKTLARQVDDDWHDGYEEQAETKEKWFKALEEPLQTVLDVGVGKEAALEQCNEVLKTVADSFWDLLANPCRCDTEEELSDMDENLKFSLPWGGEVSVKSKEPVEAWRYVWVALLRVHAAKKDTDESVLLRCIKDASDNTQRAKLNLMGALYSERTGETEKDGIGAPDSKALAKFMKEKELQWKSLPTTTKTYRMRRAIDRRFDGTPERRTRCFSNRGGGRNCVIS